jgi:hypothetical protein
VRSQAYAKSLAKANRLADAFAKADRFPDPLPKSISDAFAESIADRWT